MRKHLRGPGQATYDFDGVRPGLLVVKKGGGHQARPEKDGYGGLSAHKERSPSKKDIPCAATSFLHVEKGRKETLRGFPPKHPEVISRFSL